MESYELSLMWCERLMFWIFMQGPRRLSSRLQTGSGRRTLERKGETGAQPAVVQQGGA